MKSSFDGRRDVWGPVLALQLRAWSELVFRPAAALKQAGLYRARQIGTPPQARARGGNPTFSTAEERLHLLEEEAAPPHLRQFELAAEEYRVAVEPYTAAVFDAALPYVKPYLSDDARILDVASGPGREAHLLARRVPRGEVVATDRSRGMIHEAWSTARRECITNTAYYQQDAGTTREEFIDYFDLIYCQLSFHFFSDGAAVARAFRRQLGPAGVACIVDPGPAWFDAISSSIIKLANPAFVRYRTGDDFCKLFEEAGFAEVYWTEILPGMGLTLASAGLS